jgi:ubiquitin-associated SH3 domain-containing protein
MLRLKGWLHLSLAYGFDAEQGTELKQLAQQIIDLQSDVSWELRFYQKNLDQTWRCWHSRSI